MEVESFASNEYNRFDLEIYISMNLSAKKKSTSSNQLPVNRSQTGATTLDLATVEGRVPLGAKSVFGERRGAEELMVKG